MSDKTYTFDLPPQHKSIIKVIGVGGGGSNAVNHMYGQGIKDVEFIVCNTDLQALQTSPVPNKLQIGTKLTQGLGAGANPEKGKKAAEESEEDVESLLGHDTKMLFITAGMGGGTGTGAAPQIARIAKALDILTVGIVTQPFGFEGKKKARLAEEGIALLRENCDTVLVISNDKLKQVYSNLTISNAFGQADNVLTTAAKSIAEIITLPGYINVDFEDVKTVMANSGAAVMGSARAEGEQRAKRAAEMALSSPLLDNINIRGAEKILLSIKSGESREVQMEELDEITSFIQEESGDEAEMIFGHGVDASLGENIMVTVIATGFNTIKSQPAQPPQAAPPASTPPPQASTPPVNTAPPSAPPTNVPRVDTPRVDTPRTDVPGTDVPPVDNPWVDRPQGEEPQSDSFQPPVLPEEERRIVDLETNKPIEEPEPTPPPTPPAYRPREEPPHRPYTPPQEMSSRRFEFEPPQPPVPPINEQYRPAESEEPSSEEGAEEEFPSEISHRKKLLMKEAYQRKMKLRGRKSISDPGNHQDYFQKENYDEPAYVRRNVHLYSTPPWDDRNVSRYSLDDDNNIVGNNRFLHDNVD